MNLAGKMTLVSMITAMCIFAIAALPVTQSLIDIWLNDTSFYHGFLVLPLFITAFILKPAIFDNYPIRFEALTIPFIAITSTLMVITFVGGFNIIAHFLFVLTLVLIAIAALGRYIVKYNFALIFFLFFAVPFGTEFIVPLQNFTAHISVFLLKLSGIDVVYQGIHITTPNAKFYVAQSCAGLRFLIANVFVCYIFAYFYLQTKRSWILFGLSSILIPIIGNCLRAYLIMMIGHHTNGEYAAGVDHLIYGWGFFSFLAFINLLIGDRLSKSEPKFIETESAPALPFGTYDPTRDRFNAFYHIYEKRIFLSFFVIILIPAALQLYFNQIQNNQIIPLSIDFTEISPIKFNPDKKRDLVINFDNADHQATYKIGSAMRLQFSHYAFQNADKEVTSSEHSIFDEDKRFLLYQDKVTYKDIPFNLMVTGFIDGKKYGTLSSYYYKENGQYHFTNSKIFMQYKMMLNLLYEGQNTGGIMIIDRVMRHNSKSTDDILNGFVEVF